MNTRRNAAWNLEKDIANEGVPPRCDKVPPLEEDVNDDQAQVNPPPLMYGDIRNTFLQMSLAITTQPQAIVLNLKPRQPKLFNRLYPKQINKFLPWPLVYEISLGWINLLYMGPRLNKTCKSSLMSFIRSSMILVFYYWEDRVTHLSI